MKYKQSTSTTLDLSHTPFPLTCRGPANNNTSSVHLRIEGAESTIFESSIVSGPRNITTASGGTHRCNGLNFRANSQPGATCTSALDEVACRNNFTYDATWDDSFDDFFITRISSSSQTDTKHWGLLIDWKFANVGGCQQETKPGDYILWAYDAFNAESFLQLYPDEQVGAEKAEGSICTPLRLFVTDGLTGDPVVGATVQRLATAARSAGDVAVSDENGVATVEFSLKGRYYLKAVKLNSIRSNLVTIDVA